MCLSFRPPETISYSVVKTSPVPDKIGQFVYPVDVKTVEWYGKRTVFNEEKAMNSKDREKADWRERLRLFSDSMFRNVQIVRKRWEISACEKKRTAEISRLGNLAYRLYKNKSLTEKDIEQQVQRVEKLEIELRHLEETLRDLIIRADIPRQLPAGGPAGEKGAGAGSGGTGNKKEITEKAADEKPATDAVKRKTSAGVQGSAKPIAVKQGTPVRQVEEKGVTNAPVQGTKTAGSGSQDTVKTPVAGKPAGKTPTGKEKPDTRPLVKKDQPQVKPADVTKKKDPETKR